ncbi:facilitated trehalose transporter Tret1-like isoform X2 [Thrips palmi]|nr:facilitated trehalose transporter Tret1-like isoform X2 [Thrips palmi]
MEGKRTTQYLGAVTVCLSAMAVGSTMGWTSAADSLKNKTHDFHITEEEFAWVGAFLSIGAIFGAIPLGFLANVIGRKMVIIALAPAMTAGYLLLAFANSLAMLYVARFILGAVTGAYCVVAPMYTAEISENSIRGVLGSYFQLLITSGILFVYALNACGVSLMAINITCACIPVVMGVLVFFFYDTPVWYLSKGRSEDARKSLQFFRGTDNVENELTAIQEGIEERKRSKVKFTEAFSTREAKMGLFLALSVMLFQQFSGINAVIFYSKQIFDAAHAGIESNLSTVIVGVCQILATYVSTLMIDRLGRRLLLIFSGAMMALSGALLGVYFYIQETGDASSIGWLPITCMVVFIIVFSLGYGPIPWLYMSEVFSDQIKETAMSIATVVNWVAVFVVTKFYSDLVNSVHTYGTFWIFTIISIIGCFFTFFCVVETKGKDISEVLAELRGRRANSNVVHHEKQANGGERF